MTRAAQRPVTDQPKPAALQIAVQTLDHRERLVAAEIHAVMSLAYVQEAALLGVQHFAPLQRTVQDIQAGAEFYLGVVQDRQLLGLLSVGADDERDQLLICTLVVHPRAQRQGIGRALVRDALRRGEGMVFAVSTGADNGPALALYRAQGFVAYRRGVMGPDAVAVVKLRRAPPDTPA